MGHIFISYSHKDKTYAHKFQRYLLEQGFEAWIDDRIDYGARWPSEIEKRLRDCEAFILIMSPNSYESEWVQNELNLARKLKKPIFPLLLAGDEWWHVGTTLFVDVTGGKLPETKFYVRLAEVAGRGSGNLHPTQDDVKRGSGNPREVVSPPQNISIQVNGNVHGNLILGDGNQVQSAVGSVEKTALENAEKPISPTPAQPKTPEKKPLLKPEYIVAILGAAATILAALIGVFPWSSWFPTHPAPTSTPMLPIEVTDDKGIKMALVPAGTFTMGNTAEAALVECKRYRNDCQQDWFTDEESPHQVTLLDFYMDVYEVTNAQYKACVDAGTCQPPKNTDHYDSAQYANHPVVYVGWNQAQTYCMWRGPSANLGNARLPSEAEWEKAARSTDGRIYPWGQVIDPTFANYNSSDTAAVGSFEKGTSPYGIYDLAGNVWEWAADWYDSNYYTTLDKNAFNPLGPQSGQSRVLRGGSWDNSGYLLRTSTRFNDAPDSRNNTLGFRCARSR